MAWAALGKKAMKSLWKDALRCIGLHLVFGSSGREQIRARDVGTTVRWGTQSWSEKKPKRASGRPMMATSGKTTDSGAGQTPEVSGGTFWQGWCRRKDERGWDVVTRTNCKRGKSSEGCAPWKMFGSGNVTEQKPGGPYGWLWGATNSQPSGGVNRWSRERRQERNVSSAWQLMNEGTACCSGSGHLVGISAEGWSLKTP